MRSIAPAKVDLFQEGIRISEMLEMRDVADEIHEVQLMMFTDGEPNNVYNAGLTLSSSAPLLLFWYTSLILKHHNKL